MPYDKQGNKIQKPTKQQWQAYHLRKGGKKKTSASNQGGASIGGTGS